MCLQSMAVGFTHGKNMMPCWGSADGAVESQKSIFTVSSQAEHHFVIF